ncbi:potassium-transporting ATPase subunit KdpC [Paenibacillus sp. NPDC057967]|uniref:potassium-transporting ATPase subunit KdpC n=1 Tax=Paenibacillus sp. NPDC057967 TaxID=3346293 RepID=UPI0036DEEDFC
MVSIIIRSSLVLMLLCGVIYNIAVTGIAQLAMPYRADGSLLLNEKGQVIGSELIGQSFTEPGWFHGRVSSIGYAADGSGTPNYAPSNPELLARMQASAEEWRQANPNIPLGQVPQDLLTNSGSGLDPHISVEAALAQIPRVSQWSGVSAETLKQLVQEQTKEKELGVFGKRVVNVLLLNLELKDQVEPAG